MEHSVLVVDDEVSIQESLKGALGDEGYTVFTASSGAESLEKIHINQPDIVLLDIWMAEMDGLEVLRRIKEKWPTQTVIMMSGHGTIETAVKATKLGAYDFVEKPLSLERILLMLRNACHVQDLARENQALRTQVSRNRQLTGNSPAIQQIRDLIQKVAPTTGSVLVTGENGTGKELVAHSIHAQSNRFNKPFVEVNCAAIPEELIESELFGHEKGAFTGATHLRRGKFDLANGGTIFLDEIGDMSFKTQAKILRILQEQTFERVGGTQTISVDVRIVAATNKDLKQAIQNEKFREDLFYRLNVIPCHIPPLRERKEDIAVIAEHFLKEYCTTHGKLQRDFSREARSAMEAYSWPGNVRELKNLIERIVILATESELDRPISAADILNHLKGEISTFNPQSHYAPENSIMQSSTAAKNLRDARHEFEKQFILKILKEQDWNVSKTATVLGIERSHLHRKIKSYGIEVGDRDF